ncbi:MAG: glycosyltransferase family 39 protein [Candidatus Pseudobacter hemicellulosilyticus]|uniref:Glycosyltransferase family 39 protein n=1 Tax=Candidatus Pseudobacter hemicellulosilyticus TaxID=3121375 RepID=A0AAJ6BFW9_9BACT|nr:MAG: glycosyltransferase family 39 protein [Pseudobacter sp.]
MYPSDAQSHWETWLNRWFRPLLITSILVNAGALFITILEPDGALYASISRTMADSGDFINLKVEGRDWLDKPHFPFWMAAFSIKLFGANSFAYKFPALLFWLLGAFYTYRLALEFYSKQVAQIATLVYVTAAHLVISNNDVRAEPYLTGLVAGSVYHYYKASQQKIGWQLVAGSLLAGMALMTKGPFILITIGAGFILHWCLRKEWRQFLHPRWWLALLLVGLFTLPELLCLYWQFDSHPEKTVFGRTNVSGIRFFFWDSQFGRFFNTGPIRGKGDPTFYLHTLLWAFLPWSLLLYAALYGRLKSLLTSRLYQSREFITLGCAGFTLLLFSLSRFQLPHYSNIIFPFLAIMTADFIVHVYKKGALKAAWWCQQVLAILLPLLLLALAFFYGFPHPVLVMGGLLLLAALLFWLFRQPGLPGALGRSTGMALLVYAFINFLFYPAILRYQSGSQAAFTLASRQWTGPVFMVREAPASYSLAYYLPQPLQFCRLEDLSAKKQVALFVPEQLADSLLNADPAYRVFARLPHFHISQLTGKFINQQTRDSALQQQLILVKD